MFAPAKILALQRDGRDVLVLISVDEHNEHARKLAEKLTDSQPCIAAAACHDFGKRDNLCIGIKQKKPDTPTQFVDAYAKWLMKKSGVELDAPRRLAHALLRRGTWSQRLEALKCVLGERQSGNEIQQKVGLSTSPFPRHADNVSPKVREDLRKKGCDERWVDYGMELIRLHHSFSVRKIVSTASYLESRIRDASARRFVDDLHTIITSDNVVSAMYEKAFLSDGHFAIGDPADDSFLLHDLVIGGSVGWEDSHDQERQLVARVSLSWGKIEPVELSITYHIVEVG